MPNRVARVKFRVSATIVESRVELDYVRNLRI